MPDQQTLPIAPDPRHVALRDSLVRLREDLDRAVANIDASIALFDSLDDERLEIARRGIAASRAAMAEAHHEAQLQDVVS